MKSIALISAVCMLLISICQRNARTAPLAVSANSALGATTEDKTAEIKAVAIMRPALAATTQPTNNSVMGTVQFAQTKEGVAFVAEIDGLEPGSRHAFHIHEKPDLSNADLTSAGKQWKPATQPASSADAPKAPSMSNLGVLVADGKGHANSVGFISGATITDSPYTIVGHAVIIHRFADGRAGPRISGGAVEVVP